MDTRVLDFISPELLIIYFIPGCLNKYYYWDTEIVLIPIVATSKMKFDAK
jgi:hypothetical protein